MFKGNSIFVHKPQKAMALTMKDIEDYLFAVEHIGEHIEKMEPTLTITGRSQQQGVKGQYENQKFDSKWEACFYIYFTKIKGNYVIRNYEEYLPYYDENGKVCKFYPDFIMNGQFYEVKGRYRSKDLLKQQQCQNVIFYDGDNMKEIIHEVYKNFPNWERDYIVSYD